MMPVRLCFENKKIISFSYKKEKNHSNRCEFWFFSTLFWGTLFVYISLCKHTHTLLLLTIYIYIKSISARK